MEVHKMSKLWKITYYPKVLNGGVKGVSLVEADSKQWAIYTFQQQYTGQYHTIDTCVEL